MRLCHRKTKSIKEQWDSEKIDHNKAKIKNLRMVGRGGSATWPKFDPKLYTNTIDCGTEMKIDSVTSGTHIDGGCEEIIIKIAESQPQIAGLPAGSHTKQVSQNPVTIERKPLYQSKNTSSSLKNSNRNREESASYLELIQDVQRKRKFEEISATIKAGSSIHQIDKPSPMGGRLLNEIQQNNEIPGKFQADNSKLALIYPCQNNDDDFLDFSLGSTEDCSKTAKRSKISETENDSEFTVTVSIKEARLDRSRYQSMSTHKHSGEL